MIVNWPDAYFLSLADKDAFVDANIVTLKQEYCDNMYEQAYELLIKTDSVLSDNFDKKLDEKVEELIKKNPIPMKEYVKTDESVITVCLNVNSIDDTAVEIALNRLTFFSELKPGIYKEFGEPIIFSNEDVKFNLKKQVN